MPTRRRAFALTEVLMALVIVICALLPMLMHYDQAHRVAWGSERNVRARRLAHRMLDRLSSLGYEHLQGLAAGDGLQPLPDPLPGVAAAEGFEAAASFEVVDDDGLARVVVELTWSTKGPPSQRRTMRMRRERLVSRGDGTLVLPVPLCEVSS